MREVAGAEIARDSSDGALRECPKRSAGRDAVRVLHARFARSRGDLTGSVGGGDHKRTEVSPPFSASGDRITEIVFPF